MKATILLALILVALPAYVLAAQGQDLVVPYRSSPAVFGAQTNGENAAVLTDGTGSVSGGEILLARHWDYDRSHRYDGYRRYHYGKRHYRNHSHFGFSFSTPYYGGYYYDRPYYGSYCYRYDPYYGYYRTSGYYCYYR